VVMARAGIKTHSNEQILQSLERHWQRVTQQCAHSSAN
jgi:hypothetical protein